MTEKLHWVFDILFSHHFLDPFHFTSTAPAKVDFLRGKVLEFAFEIGGFHQGYLRLDWFHLHDLGAIGSVHLLSSECCADHVGQFRVRVAGALDVVLVIGAERSLLRGVDASALALDQFDEKHTEGVDI